MDLVRVLPPISSPNILFLVFVSGVLSGPTKVSLHSVLLAQSCDLLLSSSRVLPPGRPRPWAGAEAKLLSASLWPCQVLCPCCPSGGWDLHGLQEGAAVVLCPSRCPVSPSWGPRPSVAAEEGQACVGPSERQGWVRWQAGAGQSLSTAPGSSLVSVCQRSIRLSLFFRQSNQCFRRSPLALMPRTTPPAGGKFRGQPGTWGRCSHKPISLEPV